MRTYAALTFFSPNAGGNAAQVSSFYGADSVASYDGTSMTGKDAIASNFIAPRVRPRAYLSRSRLALRLRCRMFQA